MTQILTRETVEALLAAETKATPGPWCRGADMERLITAYRDEKGEWAKHNTTRNGWAKVIALFRSSSWRSMVQTVDDMELTAAARNLIRPLAEAYLAQLDAVKAGQIEALEGVRKPLMDVLAEGTDDMTVQEQVADDHPMMIAWEKWRLSEEGRNSGKWAHFVKASEPMQGQVILSHPHLAGSLWAAFVAGWVAAGANRKATP